MKKRHEHRCLTCSVKVECYGDCTINLRCGVHFRQRFGFDKHHGSTPWAQRKIAKREGAR